MGDAESFQEVGIPDLLFCYRGRFVGAEAKMPGNHPTAKQLAVLNEIVEAGGYALVFTTVEQVSRLLSKIDQEVAGGKARSDRFHRYDDTGHRNPRRSARE